MTLPHSLPSSSSSSSSSGLSPQRSLRLGWAVSVGAESVVGGCCWCAVSAWAARPAIRRSAPLLHHLPLSSSFSFSPAPFLPPPLVSAVSSSLAPPPLSPPLPLPAPPPPPPTLPTSYPPPPLLYASPSQFPFPLPPRPSSGPSGVSVAAPPPVSSASADGALTEPLCARPPPAPSPCFCPPSLGLWCWQQGEACPPCP